jgi:predicted nucleic acid-binding protein
VRIALDTNILVYAEGVDGPERRESALNLLERLPAGTVVPAQVLGELFNVLVRKKRLSKGEARESLLAWQDVFEIAPTTPEILQSAADLATDHDFAIWDAIIMSAASRAGCRLLLTEDLQNGFTWGGVTVINPFATERHGLLKMALGELD